MDDGATGSPARMLQYDERARASLITPLARGLFPVTQSWRYCNHAWNGPLPRPTRDAVVVMLDAQMHDGMAGTGPFEERREAVRAQVAAAIGARPAEVTFSRSTSDGAVLAANGLAWEPGDEVILSDNEFGANAYPWLLLRDRGVQVKFVRTPAARLTVEALEALATERTRLVAASYVGFYDGYRHDLPALGAWCRRRCILFAVDAMQGFGHLPLDVAAWQIDICYFAGAKWLLSPHGIGVVYVRDEVLERMRPVFASWRSMKQPYDFLDYAQELDPGAQRLDGGTIAYPAMIGLSESLRLLTEAGLENIERHVLGLTDLLEEEARRRGIEVVSDRSPGARSGILVLGLGGRSVEEVQARANAQRIAVTVRPHGIRVSPHGYNTADDVLSVLDLFEQ